MKNGFSEFSVLDAMKNHPVSAQIDEVFRHVIKEDKKASSKVKAAEESVHDHGGVKMSGDELEIKLGDDDLPPESTPLDEGFDLSISDDQSLDLGGAGDLEPQNSGDGGYGDISLDAGDADFSLAGADLGSLDSGAEEPAADFGSDFEADLGMDLGADLTSDAGSDLDSPPPSDNFDDFNSLDLSAGDTDEEQDDPNKLVLSKSDLDGGKAFDLAEPPPFEEEAEADVGFSLGDDSFDLAGDESPSLPESDDDHLNLSNLTESDEEGLDLSFGGEDDMASGEADLSADAREKLREIDAIMVSDASQVNIKADNLDEPLVSDDLDLGSINFGAEEEPEEVAPPKKEEPKKKKKEAAPEPREQKAAAPAREVARDRQLGQDLKDISVAYSGEMERMQATISNLRTDREELLAKIQKLEDDKVLQNRQSLSTRAELDERKIELTIIRRKLNEEITELRDRMKLQDEKRLILEEKNRILSQELEKAAQKNKIDVKKVIMRERELEQKLELLKADAETQIRNRDLKILELKRKIDAMEFDMESISQQEKRSVESRFELEDKLDKAIKTLRGAISVLEDENDRTNALNALKKNIDM